MTKKQNTDYWGKTYVNVNFKNYILNVVPNEFTVSYGGEYLKAGTMVVKMFGWYYLDMLINQLAGQICQCQSSRKKNGLY